jgi:ketosteroid isomerase-like protein
VRKIKVVISFVFIAAVVGALAAEAFGYPPFVAKARKFGAKDCTFCHVDPAGGPPWNEVGQWLVDEKERRKADAIDVEWLAEYFKKEKGKKNDETSAAPVSQGAGGAVEQELLKLEREWLDAYLKRDVAAMERIEADDFIITHADGRVFTKADEIANLKKSTGQSDPSMSFTTEETRVRIFGDTAILTGVFVAKQKDSTERSRYTDVYVKRNGRWQVAASHMTRIGPPPARPQSSAQAAATTSPAKVDPKVYDGYIGQYDTQFGPLNITREGDKLFGQPEGDTKEELVPESETVFNVPAVGAKITFVKDAGGKVTHMLINLQGQEMQAKKVK